MTDCRKLRDELNHLKALKRRYDETYASCLESGSFKDCEIIYRELKALLHDSDSEASRLLELNSLLKGLKIKEQFEIQEKVAIKSGLFVREKSLKKIGDKLLKKSNNEDSEDNYRPFIEKDGEKVFMPDWKEVKELLTINRAVIKEKSRQGFTKMLIVPFGLPLEEMMNCFKAHLRKMDMLGINSGDEDDPQMGVFDAQGKKVRFNRSAKEYPMSIEPELYDTAYYPEMFDQNAHNALSKDVIINKDGVWQICFVEDLDVIPYEGETVGGRKQMDRGGFFIEGQTQVPTIEEFAEGIKKMRNRQEYAYEQGMIIEAYLWMQISSLLGNERPVLMDYEDGDRKGTFLVDNFVSTFLSVVVAGWNNNSKIFDLAWETVDYSDVGNFGCRNMVIMKSR